MHNTRLRKFEIVSIIAQRKDFCKRGDGEGLEFFRFLCYNAGKYAKEVPKDERNGIYRKTKTGSLENVACR